MKICDTDPKYLYNSTFISALTNFHACALNSGHCVTCENEYQVGTQFVKQKLMLSSHPLDPDPIFYHVQFFSSASDLALNRVRQ